MPGIASEKSVRSSRVPWVVVAVILLVFASAIILVTLHLRGFMKAKLIQQDGIALGAAMLIAPSPTLDKESANDPELLLESLYGNVLEAGKRRTEVLAVRLFDRQGTLQQTIGGRDSNLTEEQIAKLGKTNAFSWYEPNAKLGEILNHKTEAIAPLIHSLVPLEKGTELLGVAEFILDGRPVEEALKRLDHDLWLYGGLIFLIGAGVSSLAVVWAFRRLERALKLLEERTRSLLRANHELTLATKTSAIGAITAHLIHDLKNPLFGLQSFVTARGSTEEEDWNIAQNTTERMQKVIGEIVRILQEEKTTEKYELSMEEVLSLLRGKLESQCAKAGITFKTECDAAGSVMNRDANIIILIVTNIVQNAIQATPRDGSITVSAVNETGCLLFIMRDTGPGLPDHIRSTLFTPSRSTKSNGSGLGLAISKQLANHIGAELLLKETSRDGTVFQLRIPDRVMVGELV